MAGYCVFVRTPSFLQTRRTPISSHPSKASFNSLLVAPEVTVTCLQGCPRRAVGARALESRPHQAGIDGGHGSACLLTLE